MTARFFKAFLDINHSTSQKYFYRVAISKLKNSILALRRGPIRYNRDATIACEGNPTEYIFLVVRGVVRSCRTYKEGSRHIVAFHFPGELFGWSGDLVHSLSAEAATDALVLFLKRSTLLATAIRDSRIASYLLAATTNELRRVQEYSLLLSRLAKCRVATFLIDLSMRMGTRTISICRCPTSILLIILDLKSRLLVGPSLHWQDQDQLRR